MLRHLNRSPSKPSRVVVLGTNGFVGGAIAKRLQTDNVDVIPITRREVDLLEADAGDRLASLLSPEDVFVAASAIAPCVNSTMLVQNTVIMRAITDALSKQPVAHVLNVSSDAVYADSTEPLTELSFRSPESIHGAMHFARELLFRNTVTAPLVSLRPTLIYGPSDPHNGYGPNRFIRLAKQGSPITLFGNGEERRDHVFIDDAAELAVRLIYMRSCGEINIATGMVHSFRDIAEKVVALSGGSVAINTVPRVGEMPHNGFRPFDPGGTSAAFPDFSYTSFDDGLAASWAAMKPERKRG
ncbi:MAG: NAD-dependent epimerase/dehydratase family protein [Gemmatimonadaceae bacterium]|nr:NAD-dependent epimerase/dehydratase family protein [Gemmatimonadaceae bacterium]MBA3655766.1 NAD-dependent epimerase/dehydratase family protein [Gemmatimonadaceae bacterium]